MEREIGQKLALESCFCGRFLLMVGHDAAGIVFFFAEGDGQIIGCLCSGADATSCPSSTDVALRSSIDVACPAAPPA